MLIKILSCACFILCILLLFLGFYTINLRKQIKQEKKELGTCPERPDLICTPGFFCDTCNPKVIDPSKPY
jgi:hypothetical protein